MRSIICLLTLATSLQVSAVAANTREDGRTPNDPLYEMQWGLRSIHAVEAWRLSRGEGAEVAVLDTGIDGKHPDLREKLSGEGWGCGKKAYVDTDGHGTHVAGIIGAATNNGEGVAGVAPAARLIAIRRAGDCDYAETIRAAAKAGANVINMSQGYGPEGFVYGPAGRLDDMKEAVQLAWDKGAVIVVSAGNSRMPLCAEPWLDAPVVCVGALNRLDLPATYTSRDVVMQSDYLVAPGGDVGLCDMEIVSTFVRGPQSPDEEATCGDLPDGYAGRHGTSMAAPHVAGVAALLAARGLDNAQIVDCLLSQADDLGPAGRDPVFGYGRVNALSSLKNCRP